MKATVTKKYDKAAHLALAEAAHNLFEVHEVKDWMLCKPYFLEQALKNYDGTKCLSWIERCLLDEKLAAKASPKGDDNEVTLPKQPKAGKKKTSVYKQPQAAAKTQPKAADVTDAMAVLQRHIDLKVNQAMNAAFGKLAKTCFGIAKSHE